MAPAVVELVEVTQMGTTTVPAATLVDTQDLETTLHPIPTGMRTSGLEHEVYGPSHSSSYTRAAVLCFHSHPTSFALP